VYQLHAAKRSDQGRRTNNEDFVDLFEPDDLEELRASGCLYLVADGVGRASQGERASQYAVMKVLYEYYHHPEVEPGERLSQALRQASRDIYQYAEGSERPMRMATTMVAAAILGGQLIVANVGDSRAYLIRNGQARRLTDDHTVPGEMVRDKLMTEEEAQHAGGKNRLTRSLGGESDVRVDVFPPIQLQAGDRVLLCTDGFWGSATRRDIEILTQEGPAEEVADRLVDFAKRRGSKDNISAIVVDVGQPVDEAIFAERMARGQERIAVDLETMETVVPVVVDPWGARIRFVRQYMPYLIATLLIFCVAAIGTRMIITNLSSRNPAKVTEIVTPTGISASPNVVPPPAEEITPSPTSEMTLEYTASPSPSPNVTTEFTTASSPTPTKDTKPPCRYTVLPNDALENIYKKLGVSVFDYSKASCAPIQDNGGCTYNSNSPGALQSGWVLDINNVDPKICKEKGGIPLE